MGEDSKKCDFWLPPEFLTDDDVFMGFKSSIKGEGNERKWYFGCDFPKEFSYGFNVFGPQSDLSSPVESVVGSTETESDEEDYISELTRQMAHSTLENHKVHGLSGSPQSTLCGVLGSKQGSNSESPNSPFMVSSPTVVQSRKGAVDLLYAAVGEVARMKKMEEEVGIWAPPRKTSPVYVDPKMSTPNLGSFYSNQPPLSYQQFQMVQFQRLKQQQLMKQRQGVLGQEKDGIWQYQLSSNHQQFPQGRDRNGGERPLNMAMSAWPTRQQSHHQQKQPPPPSQPHHCSGMRAVILGNPGPKRECAGTGVFIPRRAGTQAETRKKSGCSTVFLPDRVVQALNLNLQAQFQPRCNNGEVLKYPNNNNNVGDQQWRKLRSQPAVALSQELQLPQEWTY